MARVLFVGELSPHTTSSCREEAMCRIGHAVKSLSYSDREDPYFFYKLTWRVRNKIAKLRYGDPADIYGVNARIIELTAEKAPDVLWLDKCLMVRPSTFHRVKEVCPTTRIVGFSADDMARPANQSRSFLQSLPLYDVFITTKSYNVEELQGLGARNVLFLDNAYGEALHRPLPDVPERYDIGFVGTYEEERAGHIAALGAQGIDVTVKGGHWPDSQKGPHVNVILGEVWGDAYVEALCEAKISLCFLRKANRDLQTTRSVEIPACGRFMLAERTAEHQRLFEEGVEAEYFSSTEELVAKCKHYLEHPDERLEIARRGRERCIRDGYSYEERIRRLDIWPQ